IASREQLKKIPRLGAKTFEQAAGFLRIQNGDVALDASAVHPESYSLVQDIATKNQCEVVDLLGNKTLLAKINARDFISDEVGLPTVQDIITELDKPGRDPRPEFQVVRFKEGIEKLTDLVPDMLLEGNVTNITNFGAFVDIGVHQDGLVHISAMANKFVKDPREVVKTGDIVKVKVMSVDVKRKRIALSMRLDDSARDQEAGDGQVKRSGKPVGARVKQSAGAKDQPEGAFAAAFAKAKLGK
ncbi:MAG: S1 RNA-binding domain-containing protein, partial [Gammaproteobacteria bacterium]|nr:S1 RNA-binding domain-containing protein [Gammaproteobacteria bacterium]